MVVYVGDGGVVESCFCWCMLALARQDEGGEVRVGGDGFDDGAAEGGGGAACDCDDAGRHG